MSIDVERSRKETPGTQHVIHFNNAGAALMPKPVYDMLTSYQRDELLYGGYEVAARQADALRRTYTALAKLLKAHPEEIAVVEHATRAWDLAFYALDFTAGDRIITAPMVYASSYIALLQVSERTGAEIVVTPTDAHGQIDLDALEGLMDERVKLVAIDHCPTNSGLINPAAEVGVIAQRYGALYLLDACQSAGQLPLDAAALGADFIVGTGRKFLRGPRGTGFLYVKRAHLAWIEPPMLDMRSAKWVAADRYEMAATARRFEQWESNKAAHAALGTAVEYALGWGLGAIARRVQQLAATLRDRLSALPGVIVADVGRERSGICTFYVEGHPSAALKAALVERGINVSLVDRHSALLDMQARDLPPLVRASVHYYNTEGEITQLATTLERLISPALHQGTSSP
jgi:selenocysteine lyase/cysteine desulfurase